MDEADQAAADAATKTREAEAAAAALAAVLGTDQAPGYQWCVRITAQLNTAEDQLRRANATADKADGIDTRIREMYETNRPAELSDRVHGAHCESNSLMLQQVRSSSAAARPAGSPPAGTKYWGSTDIPSHYQQLFTLPGSVSTSPIRTSHRASRKRCRKRHATPAKRKTGWVKIRVREP
ncbi:hypothetical protein AB0F13_24650 [Streptomyces sp. NPDC026206]|uniref:hypothetical protein n=1 Tax=Streptomyces sp. NPDC026206 TaxID=3157089 RepID=UPI00340634C7